MNRKELAALIDAYADAKVSGNEYLCVMTIERLEKALEALFPEEKK
jgi:hypothetical protein